MFGPVRRVTGMARILHGELTPDRGPHHGETFQVTTPTYVSAILEFVTGVQATLVTTFGIPRSDQPHMQVYCSESTLSVPDPNTYGGPVKVRLNGAEPGWSDVTPLYHHTTESHVYSGLGAIEAAIAIRDGEAPRASGRLAYHALDVMLSILESADSGRHVEVSSRCEPPRPLPFDTDLTAGL
jgi:predicted dehydrogenase